MKFMILVKATKDSEAGVMPTDDKLLTEMVGFHEEMAKAGILVDGSGLKKSAEGWRIKPDQPPENVAVASIALREWTGLIGYKLSGKIADWFPAP